MADLQTWVLITSEPNRMTSSESIPNLFTSFSGQ
jgi:hypothetical protein